MSDDARRWLHELRNAVNGIGVTAAVVNRLLVEGKIQQAQSFVADLESGCDRCRELMKDPPDGFLKEIAEP